MTFRAAFYKGTRSGLNGIYSIAVRCWTRTPYSHCELQFSDGMSGSASFQDAGVRLKHIDYNPDKWDFIDLPIEWEESIRKKFNSKVGLSYDLLGNFGFIFPALNNRDDRYFCSEIVAECLGLEKPELFSPGTLKYTLQLVMDRYNGNRN